MTDPTSDFWPALDACMLADRHELRHRLRIAQNMARQNKPVNRTLTQIEEQIVRSRRLRDRRANAVPAQFYPPDLPVSQRKDDIAAAIRDHQVVVVCGETGSGKTTQLPKICLGLGRGVSGMIGHTQPRRLAARAVAGRVADELRSPMGSAVGYKVRFGDQTSDATLVKLMTDGILLAETQGDRDLLAYDTLIIDEAHERSLNIDFLLGYLHQLLPRRPDLKVVITSATINPQQFSRHFHDAPIIEVSGRVYPVEVRYRPPEHFLTPDGEDDDEDQDLSLALLRAVDEIAKEPGDIGSGDILVFLSGEREIREAAEELRKHHPPGTEIIPLYARLSAAEQMRVFEKHAKRRIVLSTNIAETSLTVPGIRSVIDTGLARISRYSARTKVQRLPVEAVSRASADQRKGRCGRVGPGLCIRLYAEDDFLARSEFTEPEILRTNLASVILQMKSLRLGEPEHFPFVEPPDSRMIADGHDTLVELGAIEPETAKRPGELTPVGRELAKLPIDPRVGRMILASLDESALREVLIIAAALSVQDPRERPLDKQQAADEAHARFTAENSDFLAFLNLWKFVTDQQDKLSAGRFRKLCHQNFLSYIRLREWQDIHRQLRELMLDAGHHESQRQAEPDRIHRALLAGLLANIGKKSENYEFSGARAGKFSIFPGSSLFQKPPQWVMAAEIVQTTRRYARTCARIDPRWLEDLGAHLLKRTHSDPHWSADAGQVAAMETITLFGIEIVKNRRVHYGPIDPVKSREIFIHHGLVEGEMLTKGEFFTHNHALERKIKDLEVKGRRSDLLADFDTRYRFYDARVPPGVFNTPTFEKWRAEAERKNPRLLYMDQTDLLVADASAITPENYPDRVAAGPAELPVTYRFDPGAESDGVTLNVPLEAVLQLDEDRSGWLIPGILHARVAAMVRALPKSVRRTIDAPEDLARKIIPNLKPGEGPLEEQVHAQLVGLCGQEFPADVWAGEAIPQHLRPNYRVLDEHGKPIVVGRELRLLRAQVGARATSAFQKLAEGLYNRERITEWDFGDLPASKTIRRGSAEFHGYPALADAGATAALRLFDTPGAAALSHRRGLLRLFLLRGHADLRHAGKALPGFDQMAVAYSPLGAASELRDQIVELIAERMFLGESPDVRTKAEFEARLEQGWNTLGPSRELVCREVAQILAGFQAVSLKLSAPVASVFHPAFQDTSEHLRALMNRGFLTITPRAWLAQYPRYLAASAARLDKLGGQGLARDEELRGMLRPLWHQLLARAQSHAQQGLLDPELVQYRWMLEEYRVSLFAQHFRTVLPISEKRLARQWAKVRP